MCQILHVLKETEAKEALRIIEKQAASDAESLAILLIQEGVRLDPSVKVRTYVLGEDLSSRNLTTSFESIDYEKMLELIFQADQIVTW